MFTHDRRRQATTNRNWSVTEEAWDVQTLNKQSFSYSISTLYNDEITRNILKHFVMVLVWDNVIYSNYLNCALLIDGLRNNRLFKTLSIFNNDKV